MAVTKIRISDIKCEGLPHSSFRNQPSKFYVKLTVDNETQKTDVSLRSCDPVWNEVFDFQVSGSSELNIAVYANHRIRSKDCVAWITERIGPLVSRVDKQTIQRPLIKPNVHGVRVQLGCTVAFSIISLEAPDRSVGAENPQQPHLNPSPPPTMTEELAAPSNAATGSSLTIPDADDTDFDNGYVAEGSEVRIMEETPGMVLLPRPSFTAEQATSHGQVTTSQTTFPKLSPLSQANNPKYHSNSPPIFDVEERPSKSNVLRLSPTHRDTNTSAPAANASFTADNGSFNVNNVVDSSQANANAKSITPDGPSVSGTKFALEKAKMELAHIRTRSFGDTIDSILNKMNFVIDLGAKFAELNPYAKLAWSVVSSVPKAISAQGDRDESVLDLCTTIDTAFSFLEDAEQRAMLNSRKTVFTRMVQQTTECAYFISEYARNPNFWKRVGKHTITNIDDAIKSYNNKFAELSAAFLLGTNIETEICVLRVLDTVHAVDIKLDLMDMPYAKGAGYSPEKGCLSGTRQSIVDEIVAWVNTPNVSSRLFWLSGVAGSGKTSIANTVARIFDNQKRLGSFFAFDIAHQADRRPCELFSTIAVNLAALDTHWKSSLWEIIKDDPALRTTSSPELQFTKFLLEMGHTTGYSLIGPIVVIIDGMDESGDEDSRKDILCMLAQRATDLPSNLRIILTSRPESDIRTFLSPRPHIHEKSMSTIDPQSNAKDIQTFFRLELSSFIASSSKWTEDEWLRILVDRSEGLFQWASTACSFIKGMGTKVALTPVERFETILTATNLDSLYFGILTRLFSVDDNTSLCRVKAVLGMVVVAIEPLSTLALYDMYDDLGGGIVDSVLDPLGALLTGIGQKSVPVRPLHTSFHDFLIDATRSKIFHVDASTSHRAFLSRCLKIMKAGLQFNICKLETSYLLNSEVPDLSSRIDKHISPSLSYACHFGLHHLNHCATPDSDLYRDLCEFMYKQFLYWLEVISITRASIGAIEALGTVIAWSQNLSHPDSSDNRDLFVFARDAYDFVNTFTDLIWQSVPHIYLSALPFTPRDSLISKTFLPSFPNTLSIEPRSPVHDGVRALAYSPDGDYIVSGSSDAKILIWNVKTGQVAVGPLRGHNTAVTTLAYSPDGSYICSGSVDGDVRLWTLAHSNVSPTIFRGHADFVTTVSFSLDSQHIASGSYDGTVRLWDITNPDHPPQTFDYHTHGHISVVFSRDKTQIRSGLNSSEISMCIWDLNSGTQTTTHLSETDDDYGEITISPNGRYFAAKMDTRPEFSISIWDTKHQNNRLSLVLSPLDSNTNTLKFSPDNNHLASCSIDGQLHVWDVEARTCIRKFVHGYVMPCVAFSPDGTHIVSGSEDGTIHVLDLSNVQAGHDVVKKLFWVVGSDNQNHWEGLWWTDDGIYMESSLRYIIDRTRFVHGPRWTECKSRFTY